MVLYYAENMLLLGSIHRSELHRVIDRQLSEEAKEAFFEMLSKERAKLAEMKAAQKAQSVNNTSTEDTGLPPVHKVNSVTYRQG